MLGVGVALWQRYIEAKIEKSPLRQLKTCLKLDWKGTDRKIHEGTWYRLDTTGEDLGRFYVKRAFN